jgi:hypothetical protein
MSFDIDQCTRCYATLLCAMAQWNPPLNVCPVCRQVLENGPQFFEAAGLFDGVWITVRRCIWEDNYHGRNVSLNRCTVCAWLNRRPTCQQTE